jgi:hypothetical protein
MKEETKKNIAEVVVDSVVSGILGAGAALAYCVFGGEKPKNIAKPLGIGFGYGAVVGGLGSAADKAHKAHKAKKLLNKTN